MTIFPGPDIKQVRQASEDVWRVEQAKMLSTSAG